MLKNPNRHQDRNRTGEFSETRIHKNCVQWFRMQYARFTVCLFHPANGGARDAKEAAILKGMGVVSGVSDLILMIPNTEHHGLIIEIKTPAAYAKKDHSLSENQQRFLEWMAAMNYRTEVITSVEQFIDVISDYMSKTPWFKPTWRDQARADKGEQPS